MAFSTQLPFIDSVSHYNNNSVTGKWVFTGVPGAIVPTPGAGRTALNGALVGVDGGTSSYTGFGSVQNLACGGAYMSQQAEADTLLNVFGSGAQSPQVTIKPFIPFPFGNPINGVWIMSLSQQNNGAAVTTNFGSGGRPTVPGAWIYLELLVSVNATATTASVYVNGHLEANLTYSASFVQGNNNYAHYDTVTYGSKSGALGSTSWCDLYVATALMGDIFVPYITASGAGAHTVWVSGRNGVPNWQNVDNVIPPANANAYNQGNNVGDEDTYALQALPANTLTSITAVQGVEYMNTDTNTANVTFTYRNGTGNEQSGTTFTATANATILHEASNTSPFTGNSWTLAEVGNMQFGQTRTS